MKKTKGLLDSDLLLFVNESYNVVHFKLLIISIYDGKIKPKTTIGCTDHCHKENLIEVGNRNSVWSQ